MSITLGKSSIHRLDRGKGNQYIVVQALTGLPVFYESALLVNGGDPKNREHWVQILTSISEISSTDHNCNQTTDNNSIRNPGQTL